MAQKILSIDIREDLVCGVMVLQSGSESTVIECNVSVVIDKSYKDAVEDVLGHLSYSGELCRVSFGAENFFFRNLSFPFHDKKKIERILGNELEENVPLDISDLLVDSLVTGKKGQESTVVAAMAYREFIAERLDELKSLQIDPEIIAISSVQTALQLSRISSLADFILLDCSCCRFTIFVMQDGRMRLIRPFVFDDGSLAQFSLDKNSQFVSAKKVEKIADTYKTLCREVRRTLYSIENIEPDIPVYLTGPLAGIQGSSEQIAENLGSDVVVCDLVGNSIKVGMGCGLWRADVMTSAMALAVRSGKKQAGFNFRKAEFARRVSYQKYKKIIPRLAIPAALCLVVGMGYLWNDYSLRQKQLHSLEKEGETIFTATLPEVTRIVDPVQQLRVEIREMKKGALGEATTLPDLKMLDIMAELSVRIPQSINVHILRMVADRKGILVRGLTDNFNSVDSLKKVLERSNYFESVTINSANLFFFSDVTF